MSSTNTPDVHRGTLPLCGVCPALAGEPCEPTCEAAASHSVVEPGHSRPWINPVSSEGTKILQLFAQLKDLADEDSEGNWTAGNVVDYLRTWFPTMGIGIYDTYDSVVEHLMGGLRPHTVFGLRDNHTPGTTLISAVAVGEITGAHRRSQGRWERVTTCVLATDADHAEVLAYVLFEHERAAKAEPTHGELPVFADAVRAASQQLTARDSGAASTQSPWREPAPGSAGPLTPLGFPSDPAPSAEPSALGEDS